ncbi:DUF7927 domain-containing protein [Cellulomonas fengjieae]|uniref:VWA domain-containing protein n=1 Tax=Cellulomonas fengjieae TaxID=2819978 RepID=A0ABS3SLK7_9CELL|nr:VWA domain-containing protein [Cellulomonas fengjieae]MBO3086605.1 VWA domain-containing protein [Cellulomonas fengjieae]QVI66546.1 VWA domain-containing protein [Cellulomonas fengjieae]
MDKSLRRLRRFGAALLSAVLALAFLALGAAPSQARGPGAVPMVVPPATGNNAVITVQVGADRQGTRGVSGLAGVTLQLYDGGTTGPTTPVADAWATCTSDADGDCSFVVPNTQSGIFGCFGAAAGANCDRRFWIVQTGVPDGFTQNSTLRTGNGNGTGSQLTPYQFRTGTTLRAGNTYTSSSDFMVGTGSTNRSASGGIWQQSRTNPPPVQSCGLRVALVLDLSGSVTSPQLAALKSASDTFVDALTGTPSEAALFSFSTATPALGATQNYPGLSPISTPAAAAEFKARYASWTSQGGTNWDRGLAAPAEAAAEYDVAIVITDGDPTYYNQPAEGPGNFTRLREMENGIFSANALKAQGTRVLAVGVGAGVSDAATAQNLRAISGPTAYDGTNSQAADYYQVTDYSAVGQALRQLALGECAGSLSVVKQIVDSSGDLSTATPGGAGWTFDASTATTGVTIANPSATTDSSSAVNFPLTYGGGVTSGAIEVQEQPQTGTTLFPVDGANAVCTDLDTDQPLTVTNAEPTGFTVDVPSTDAVTCTVYNQVAAPASVTVDKEWAINGAAPVPEGSQPAGFTSQLTLTGPDGAAASNQPWRVTRSGYVAGDAVTIDEQVTLQAPDIDADLCTVSTPQIVEIDGAVVTPVPVPQGGYAATLIEGANTFTIRNTVTCESRLTLAKNVEGAADPALWTLDALPTAAGSQLPGPSGQAGSTGVTDVSVTAGIAYQLAESGGPATYLQVDQRSDLQTYPLATGSWNCIRIDAEGNQVSGFADGLNGGVTVPIAERVSCTATNQTAQLVLAKEVNNTAGGTAVASDFTLRAVPSTTPPVTGLSDVEVPGAAQADAQVVEIRPDHTYTLDETGPAGYGLTDLQCTIDGVLQPVTEVTVGRGETVVCDFVNTDNPAQLTLRKSVEAGATGATEVPADWTLTATPQDIEDQEPVSGNGADGVTDEEVAAGPYALTESTIAGFDAQEWACVDAGGEDVTVDAGVVTLENGSDVTCTIANVAVQPTLTLVKEVTNDDGGSAVVGDWILTADGPTPVTGATGDTEITGAPVAIGSYALSEDGPAGYTPGEWACAADTTDLPVADGAVEIGLGQDVTCTITNDDQPAQLTLRKAVEPGTTGATQTPADWTLTADGPDTVSGNGADGVTDAPVAAGSYALSESTVAGFDAGAWGCVDASGTVPVTDDEVVLTSGADVTCTITNTAQQPTLTLVKLLTTDQGGSAVVGDWTLTATGPTTGVTGATGDPEVTDAPVAIGSYALAEEGPAGYTAGEWACEAGGTALTVTDGAVDIGLGQDVTCTIENDDQPALLTLRKVVDVGATGATAEPADWTVRAAPEDIPGQDIVEGDGADGVTDVAVFAGPYALSESFVDGFSAGTWGCVDAAGASVVVDQGTVTLTSGADVTCTITNTAVPSTLTLTKLVTNDDGGTADARDWVLVAIGPTTSRAGATGDDDITSAPVEVGRHAISESGGPTGYTTNDWTCADGDTDLPVESGSVLIGLGQDVTCTVLNDDQPGTLTLVKEVVNDGGGTAEVTDWTLVADGPTPGISGQTGSAAVTGVDVSAGSYTLSEADGPSGYSASPWTCTGGTVTGDIVTVANGEEVTCTITNRFQPPLLTLVKQVVNDGGGTAVATDWTLAADGPVPVSGTTGSTAVTGAAVAPGTYTLSESGPAGYVGTGWACENRGAPVTLDGADLDLAAGDDVICTVTNVFTPAQVSTWTAEKSSDPPSGTQVDPGEVITYTVRAGIVTGDRAAGVVITDDLSDVLDDARLVAGSIRASAGTATLSGTQLTWTIGTLEGVQALIYQVRVDDDVNGDVLRNVVTAPGALPCPPEGTALGAAAVGEDDCRSTTHLTPTAPGTTWGGGWLSDTGGPEPWLGIVALGLLATGAAMRWGTRRGARVPPEG